MKDQNIHEYKVVFSKTRVKRYCKTLELIDDPEMMELYKKAHAPGSAWPEITQNMREVGIIDMEIYLHQKQLFMIMDTVPDFDHEQAMAELARKPRQREWEDWMSKFQKASSSDAAHEKWQLMERIFKLEE